MHYDEIASVACCCMFNWLEFCCVFPAQALEVLACPAWISTPGKSFSAHTHNVITTFHVSCLGWCLKVVIRRMWNVAIQLFM